MIGENQETATVGGGDRSSGGNMPTLEEYGTNLTKLAEEVNFYIFLSVWLDSFGGVIEAALIFLG